MASSKPVDDIAMCIQRRDFLSIGRHREWVDRHVVLAILSIDREAVFAIYLNRPMNNFSQRSFIEFPVARIAVRECTGGNQREQERSRREKDSMRAHECGLERQGSPLFSYGAVAQYAPAMPTFRSPRALVPC